MTPVNMFYIHLQAFLEHFCYYPVFFVKHKARIIVLISISKKFGMLLY